MREIYRTGTDSPTGSNNIEQEHDFINRFINANYGVCVNNAVTGSLIAEIACIQEARRQPKVITARDAGILRLKLNNIMGADSCDAFKVRLLNMKEFLEKIGVFD